MPKLDFLKHIDHTLLKPEAQEKDIIQLCKEAKEFGFGTICLNPCYVNLAAKLLTGTNIRIATVIGFPLGATTKEVKAFETEQAFKAGADEVDMVINIGALKSGKYEIVKEDIEAVVRIAKSQIPKKLVKVIIETGLLNQEEKAQACSLAVAAGADFVKTSTGFNSGGATVEDVKLIKKTIGNKALVKASGGIRSLATLEKMLKAGASRIGTSAGVIINSELENKTEEQ